MSRLTSLRAAALAAVAGLGLASAANAELIYGMTAAGSGSTSPGLSLVSFDSASPGTVNTVGAFTGVSAGHALRSLDFRPANGQLYAISTATAALATAQIYTVNLATAALTPVGSGLTLTGNTSGRVEMDFNPSVDRIRIVTGGSANNNYRANPNDGLLVLQDTDLSGLAASIIGAAYSNNVAGGTPTTLYAWDYNTDDLVTIGGLNGVPSPNGGVISVVADPAPSFLTFNASLGMDISGATGTLYVTHDNAVNGNSMNLYTRDLTSGAETLLGAYPTGTFVADISVVVPEPTTLGLAGVAAMGLLRRRRA